jgi:1,4-alpha-glucan branching enzyme
MNQSFGSFVLVLHAHIPYVVSHGNWPHGTDWLSEASAETYLPLLRTLWELEAEGITPKITIGLSPILTEQLADPVFQNELSAYLEMKLKAAENDRIYFRSIGETAMLKLAEEWVAFYTNCRDDFNHRYHQHILDGFREYLEKGFLDIITCGATHGYFPLIGEDACINLQVKTAVETHKKHLGRAPRGIWMPECAYRPGYVWKRPVNDNYSNEPYQRYGIEEFLVEHGIEYTFIDAHLLKGGQAIGAYADRFEGLRLLLQQIEKAYTVRELKDLSPYLLYEIQSSRHSDKGVAIFTRDPRTGLQVWSGEHGYPGDGWYMDFHKKRFPGGLRYWRVTSLKCGLGDKELYNSEIVESRLEENASHFVAVVHEELAEHKRKSGLPGVLTAPYDAELFGHWWFEGCRFIKKLYEKFNQSSLVLPTTAAEAFDSHTPAITVSIPEGSWGEDGFHYIWLNQNTEWTWRDIYRDELTVLELVKKVYTVNSSEFTILVIQIIRELLLEHSSDWQFLISTFSARDYAEMRFSNHHSALCRLADIASHYIKSGTISDEDRYYIEEISQRDHPFPHLQWEWLADLK